MAIIYPLALPTVTGVAQIELRAINAVAYSRSPFTFSGQAHAYSGQAWQADITLPPMKRDAAEVWISWLIALRGQFGTFLLNDPSGVTPRGSAGGSPLVNGAAQTGNLINIDGCLPSQTGWLKAGDYVQFGSGASASLHKVLEDVNSNASGETTLEIWPSVRNAPSDNSSVVTSSAKGLFRLSSNEQAWSVNEASIYGITFGAMEAI
jgi:hypothetical protein